MIRKLWRDHWHNIPIGAVCALGIAAGWYAASIGGMS